jgi:DNA-binding NarL/FixJ family response regulator
VYDRVPRGARLGAHARAAKALEAAGVPASARAHHIERSATPGDQQAIAELVDAAHEVVGRAPLAAGRWLAAAAALLSARDAPARRARLLSEAGSAFTSAGAYEDSLASLQEALSLVSVGQIDARADLVAKLAYAKRRSGRPFDSRHLVEAALGSLPSDSPAAPSLRHELAFDQLWHDEFDATRHQAQELLRSGYAQCDQALVCIAATLMSLADSSEDRLEQARANLSEARDACGGLTDEQLAERIYLAFYLGVSALRLEHADEALAFVYRGIDIARSTGQEATTTPWLAIAAQALLLKGRVSEASRVAATAIDDALLTANDWRTIWALEADALANYTAGDPTRALSSANEMLTRAERTHPFLTDHARIQLAGALYAAGDPARALTELAALDTRPRSWLLNLHAGHGWDVPIHAYLALGEVEPARERAACASANAAARGLPQQTASARCAEAAVLLECRDPDGATRAASEAVAIAASAGNPVLSARGQASVGAALAATGDRQGGIAALEQAEQALSACGARRYADIAAQQLRHLGQRVPRRSRRSTGPGLAELSPREREVADQVAKGKTNREIAGTLFLSDKTIETHLAHIYAKLGVKSRATLAALIAREEQSLEI